MELTVIESGKISKNELTFILAGKAIFTLRSTETGVRYTYKVSQCKTNSNLWFVSVLFGSDNTSNYSYMGVIRKISDSFFFETTTKSRLRPTDKRVMAFDFTMKRLFRGTPDARVEIWHEGRCGRCGRLLTVPESIESGFGPECITLI